jgi:hypothetical protein
MLSKRLFIALLWSVLVTTTQGANLLTNSKFNTGDLTGWKVALAPYPDTNAYVQTAITYDGSPCLFMWSRTSNWQIGASVYQQVNVSGLTEVEFSCVVNKWAWGDARLELHWFNNAGPNVPSDPNIRFDSYDIVVNGAETDDWDSFTQTITPPVGAVSAIVLLRTTDYMWQVYYDDLFFGIPPRDQAVLVAPPPGSLMPEEEKSNCGFGPTLRWNKGQDANGAHYVYFGTSFADVNDANTNDPEYKTSLPLGTTSYTLSLADVDKGQAYFWRVDETVNNVVVKAQSVWQFSVSNVTWVDGFDNYITDANIRAVWGPNSSVSDSNMRIVYNSTKYAVSANTPALLCSNDISSNAMLVLTVKGHDNMSNNVYVKLESNNGAQSGIVHFPDKRELNQQSYEPLILWPIALQEFASQGVVLTNVTKITIGIDNGSGGPPAGTGTVYIDDIRLDHPWCNPTLAEMIPADFSKNCWVGMEDLDLLANNWLATSTQVTAAAPPTGPILWYPFNEGAGNDPLDFSGNSYDGWISDLDAWGGPGTGLLGTDCVYLNNTDWIEIIDAGVNNDHAIGAESTVSVWLKDPGQADADSMILQIGYEGHSINIWTGATGSFSYKAGWNTALGWGDTLDVGSQDYTNPDHPQDQWVHFAFVKSFSGGYMKVYRNGRLIAESTAATNETPQIDGLSNGFASVGAWRWSGSPSTGGYYNGWLDDLRIYDYALSPEQVLYLAVQGGTATSPMTQGLLTGSDATGDDVVNFYDFAVMGELWLQDVVWP